MLPLTAIKFRLITRANRRTGTCRVPSCQWVCWATWQKGVCGVDVTPSNCPFIC